MSFAVQGGRYALCGFAEAPVEGDWAALARPPCMFVRERGETTLLLFENEVAALLERHPSAKVKRGFVWIRFEAPMTFDVVGFLAHVTGELARAGIPLGVVCSFSRDHLFISERFLPKVKAILARSFPER